MNPANLGSGVGDLHYKSIRVGNFLLAGSGNWTCRSSASIECIKFTWLTAYGKARALCYEGKIWERGEALTP